MEIRKEHKKLSAEQKKLQGLMKSEASRWAAIGEEIEATRQKFGGDTALGRRRTTPGAALPEIVVDEMAFVEKEPITVILSEKGWIRAHKGHLPADAELRFKEGDALHLAVHAMTTDRIVLFATSGKAYTLKADAIPRGRGDGQPLRLMVEMTNEDAVVAMFVHQDGVKWLLAATDGKGFVAKAEEMLAEKRTGKQVLLVEAGKEALVCTPAQGDSVAATTEARLLVFPLDQVPEMSRGRGVQRIPARIAEAGERGIELGAGQLERTRVGDLDTVEAARVLEHRRVASRAHVAQDVGGDALDRLVLVGLPGEQRGEPRVEAGLGGVEAVDVGSGCVHGSASGRIRRARRRPPRARVARGAARVRRSAS
jgi:DNA gyrase/topoisomerase IV subunit A